MNNNITFRSILTAFVFLCAVLSCTKEGAVGPQGEPGEQGVAGADGSRMYSGTDAPATSLGNEGDFYFRSSNSDFYGPKTGSGWGSPTNMRGAAGAQGAAGAAGSKILTGTAVPATTVGAAGDFYFRSTTGDFYGPKTGSGWGIPINLKGVQGEDGSRIYSGTTAPAITLGGLGDFYFRTTTGDFYGPKTASGWGAGTSLKGATGSTGAAGSKILSGASAPTTAQGTVGDYYIHTATANLYGPKTATGWGTPIMNLRGIQGPTGPQGPPGTANVIYSDWIPTPCTNCSGFDITAPKLTQAIFDRGQIAVYRKFTTHGFTLIEPVSGTHDAYGIYYWAVVGQIWIRTGDYMIGNEENEAFRYVLIPGSVTASANIRLDNYKTVKTVFGLPN